MKKVLKNLKIVERWGPTKDQLWLKEFNKAIMEVILPKIKGKVVLDAGCGSGLFEKLAQAYYPKQIDAFDISETALLVAKKYLNQSRSLNNINFKAKNFNNSGFNTNYYDVIVSAEVIEHLTKYKFYISNLYKALKNKGKLFLSTPNKSKSPGLNKYHKQEFTHDEMLNLLSEAGFKVTQVLGIERNSASKITEKYVPQGLISLFKTLPFYEVIIKIFFRFKKTKPENASTILYIARK